MRVRSWIVAAGVGWATALLTPVAALAQRDCCFARTLPPGLQTIGMIGPVGPTLDALERLGFAPVRDGRLAIGGVPGVGGLGGVFELSAPRDPGNTGFAGVPGRIQFGVYRFALACGPTRPGIVLTIPPCPNGAYRLTRVTAIAASFDQVCAPVLRQQMGSYGMPRFGPAFAVPELGAQARDAEMENGTLRVLVPDRPDGPAARWLREAGGPYWLGFAVRVNDLVATEAALARAGVRFERVADPDGMALWVDPSDAAGLLVEFVDHGRR